jgi:two-component system, cell cycle response regulator DivK
MATLVLPEMKSADRRRVSGHPLVLLVDDYSVVREACALFCERSGFRVAQAGDGPEAVQKALLLRPAAIVLDLLLPTIPGWEVATALRNDARTAKTPILATSGLHRTEGERKARAAGATHYLPKPFDGFTLVRRLREMLGI